MRGSFRRGDGESNVLGLLAMIILGLSESRRSLHDFQKKRSFYKKYPCSLPPVRLGHRKL